jgi:single-stranded DNA-binding protein
MSVRNIIFIIGNIGKVNVLPIQDGREPATAVSVGIEDSYKAKDATEWTERTIWAELILTGDRTNSLNVGDLVSVKGKAIADAYLDKEGKPVGTLKIMNPQLSVLSRKDKSEAQEA